MKSDLGYLSSEAQSQMFASPAVIQPAFAELLSPLVEQLQRGLQHGEFHDIDPDTAAQSIQGVVWACTERQWATGNYDRAQVRQSALRFCLRGAGRGSRNDHHHRFVPRTQAASLSKGRDDGSRTRRIESRRHRRQQGHGAGHCRDPGSGRGQRRRNARGQTALDAAVAMLRAAGAPDAVGISVDMADARSIAAGFATIEDRWGEINSLVNTIGPGDGYFEDIADADWDTAFQLGTWPASARSRRAAAAACRRLGPHREIRRALDPAAEPAHRRLHGVKGRARQRLEEPGEEPRQGRHPRELVCPGTIVTASFTEALEIPRRRRARRRPTRSTS